VVLIFVLKLVFSFIAVLLGFTVHEFAHAMTAYRLGDPTQKYEGRLTLNPFAHLDWIGALVLMASMILTGGRCVVGWGKPVAICAEALKDPVIDGGIASFAGPFANITLAIMAGIPVKLGLFDSIFILDRPLIADFLGIVASINIALFIFNMIPFPPLDGWKTLQIIVPRDMAYKMREIETSWGSVPMYCLMGLVVFFGPFFIAPIYIKILEIVVGRIPFA